MSCIITNYTASPTVNIPFPCNTIVGSENTLGGGIAYEAYGYLLNKSSVYAFLIIFSILCAGHIAAGIYHRLRWAFFTLVPGATLEVLGWAGRFWSWHKTVWDPNQGGQWNNISNGFTMQICCLIIGPTFFSAANYLLLGTLIRKTDGRFSSVSARSFSVLFTIADVICLIVQGIGGGVTGGANTNDETKNGLHIMAVGVVIQLALTLLFIFFLGEYIWRFRNDKDAPRLVDLLGPFDKLFGLCRRRRSRPSKVGAGNNGQSMENQGMQNGSKSMGDSTPNEVPGEHTTNVGVVIAPSDSTIKKMLIALSISTLLLVARGIYRCVELLDFKGENSGAYADQGLFIGMDAVLMMLLLIVQLALHPGMVAGRTLTLSRSSRA